MYDVIIKGGTIIDGTGDPMIGADLGIKEGFITAIGDLHNDSAQKIIDARGRFVTPGFIDVNNHSDTYWRIFANPDLESMVGQGITTIIGGNCGSSLAPLLNKDIIRTIQKWADIRNVAFNWLGMGEFLEEVERRKLSVNFGTLAGHATLRRGFVGDETRDISPQEMRLMKTMLKDAMKEGALGLSTGLVYTHARLASSREIDELAEIIKYYDGVYATHIRGEGEELLHAVQEAIRISRHTGVRLQISHLKAMGRQNWSLMEEAIDLIQDARTGGVDVHFDVYPYTATGSVLYILLPSWVSEGGRTMMLARLRDPDMRKRAVKDMQDSGFDYSKITVSISSIDKTLNRKRIADIAAAQGKSMEDAVIDVLLASEGRVVALMEVLSEKNVDKGVVNPFSIISSNGSGYNIKHKESGELVHPRSFGAFPRVLARYVRERGVVGWEEAIRKMSGLPAEKYRIPKRGLLKKGYCADVVVFDPENIRDLATVGNPYQYPLGIGWVFVNGKAAIADGVYKGERSGEIIRRKTSLFRF